MSRAISFIMASIVEGKFRQVFVHVVEAGVSRRPFE
jgi:hypothetical protein